MNKKDRAVWLALAKLDFPAKWNSGHRLDRPSLCGLCSHSLGVGCVSAVSFVGCNANQNYKRVARGEDCIKFTPATSLEATVDVIGLWLQGILHDPFSMERQQSRQAAV